MLFKKKEFNVDLNSSYYKNPIVRICFNIIMNRFFDAGIMFVILLNTVTLSLDKYPEFPDWTLNAVKILNYIFTAVFTIEVVLKMIGLGVKKFMIEKFNQFDLLIVLISYAEIQF